MKILRSLSRPLLLSLTLAACGGAAAGGGGAETPKPGTTVTAINTTENTNSKSNTNDPGASAKGGPADSAEPAPSSAAATDPSSAGATGATSSVQAAPSGPWPELETSPGAPELTEGVAALVARDWFKARRTLTAALTAMQKTASLDALLAGNALLGRACAELKDKKCADAAFGAVQALWGDPEAKKKLESVGSDDAARELALKRALLAVAEAHFFAAESKRAEIDRLRMPEYKGSSDRDDMLKHIHGKVAVWARDKRAMIEDAEKAYLKVVELTPSSPPRWAVRAGARVGQMWGRFTAEFRAAPIPEAWKKTGNVPGKEGVTYKDIRAQYYAELDKASETVKAQARLSYQKCQGISKKLGYADEHTRHCDVWLEKNTTASAAPPAPAP
jgi:hypothetical protein